MARDERTEQRPQQPPRDERPDWFRRVGWLALIWAASVAALLVVAMLFRLAMKWVGLTA